MKLNKNIYKPVSCEQHSQYELAIMHKKKLQLVYKDENSSTISDIVTPIDVQTVNKAEYLVALSSENKKFHVRLDYIEKFNIFNKS